MPPRRYRAFKWSMNRAQSSHLRGCHDGGSAFNRDFPGCRPAGRAGNSSEESGFDFLNA
jgi:hypothetical protein